MAFLIAGSAGLAPDREKLGSREALDRARGLVDEVSEFAGAHEAEVDQAEPVADSELLGPVPIQTGDNRASALGPVARAPEMTLDRDQALAPVAISDRAPRQAHIRVIMDPRLFGVAVIVPTGRDVLGDLIQREARLPVVAWRVSDHEISTTALGIATGALGSGLGHEIAENPSRLAWRVSRLLQSLGDRLRVAGRAHHGSGSIPEVARLVRLGEIESLGPSLGDSRLDLDLRPSSANDLGSLGRGNHTRQTLGTRQAVAFLDAGFQHPAFDGRLGPAVVRQLVAEGYLIDYAFHGFSPVRGNPYNRGFRWVFSKDYRRSTPLVNPREQLRGLAMLGRLCLGMATGTVTCRF